ncbi:hypothetical protein Tco_0785361 [Tanacetum coccineum]
MANLDPMTNLAFVEANYEVLESLLREHKRRMRNEDLRNELEYFNKERVVEFKDAPNRDGGRVERNSEGRPSEQRAEDNKHQEVSLPPLLAAYLGRNENGEPLESSLTFAHGGHHPLVNAGGNIPPNGQKSHLQGNLRLVSYGGYALQDHISSNISTSNGFVYSSAAPSNKFPLYT